MGNKKAGRLSPDIHNTTQHKTQNTKTQHKKHNTQKKHGLPSYNLLPIWVTNKPRHSANLQLNEDFFLLIFTQNMSKTYAQKTN